MDEIYNLLKSRKFFFWGLYILFFPFYFLPPGYPQMSDVFLVLFVALNLKNIFNCLRDFIFSKWLLTFVIYSFIVNFAWSIILDNFYGIKFSFNYLYNFLTVIALLSNIRNVKFLKYTFACVCIIISIYAIASLGTIANWGLRTRAYFNNPNQLALWGLCMLAMVNTIGEYLQLKKIYITIFSMICSFFVILSISKSGLLGIAFYWFYIIIWRLNKIQKVIVIIITISLSISFGKTISQNIVLSNLEQRFSKDSTSDDSLSGRGIDRLYNDYQYLFLGAGEGSSGRFDSALSHHELHSTFLNILFSYGIIGFFAFMFFIIRIIRPFKIESVALFSSIFLYTIAHNALRIPMMWLAFSFLMLYKLPKPSEYVINAKK